MFRLMNLKLELSSQGSPPLTETNTLTSLTRRFYELVTCM